MPRAVRCKGCGEIINYSDSYGPYLGSGLPCQCEKEEEMSSTNRGAKRVDADAYYTPQWCIDLILPEIDFPTIGTVLEPAAGDKRIVDSVQSYCCDKYDVPVDIEWCEITESIDYFTIYGECDLVITNPPFSLALEFCDKALNEAANVVMLLRLGFLGSQARKGWWQQHPPSRLFALSKRPSFVHVCKGMRDKKGCGASWRPDEAPKVCPHCNNPVGAGTDSADYGWFCWGSGFYRPSGVYVL